MLEILQALRESPMIGHDPAERALLGRAVHAYLDTLCSPLYDVPADKAIQFIADGVLVANTLSILDATTDPWIATVLDQPQSGFKTLAMYSARNHCKVDLKSLMGQNPDLVSNWFYCAYQMVFSGMPSRHVVDRLIEFALEMDDRLVVGLNMQEAYFGVTYTGSLEAERHVKSLINRAVQKVQPADALTGDPDPREIAVFAEYWSEGHSVYRSLCNYIGELGIGNRLTLLYSTREPKDLDMSLFADSVRLTLTENGLDVSPLAGRRFGAAVFCDVGMTTPSIFASNLRIAPVQVMLTGHPVSTFGSQIDYFLSGNLVEDPEDHEDRYHYSETPVFLPGYGATHTRPTYKHTGRKNETDATIISCSWYGQKVHYESLEILDRAIATSKAKVLVRIFSGNAPLLHKGAYAFMRDVQAVLKSARVELYPHLGYDEYMGMLEESDFAVDSFPFGGSNVASDFLHLGVPIVSRRGDRWFNRIGPAMIEQAVGWNPSSDMAYQHESAIHDMLRGCEFRRLMRTTFRHADLDKVYDTHGASQFSEWLEAKIASPGLHQRSAARTIHLAPSTEDCNQRHDS